MLKLIQAAYSLAHALKRGAVKRTTKAQTATDDALVRAVDAHSRVQTVLTDRKALLAGIK